VPTEPNVTLTLANQEATVATLGGRVVDYRSNGRDILVGTENPALFAFRGSLLAPWPNRVVGGRWTWQGRQLELAVNDPASGAALHGLVAEVEWDVEHVDSCSIRLGYDLPATPGYPIPLRLTAAYSLSTDGLACALTATNAGEDPAPVGLGVHPYLAASGLVDDLVVTIPAATLLQTDDAWRETGRPAAATVGLDFTSPRRLGDLVLDAAYTDVTFAANGRTECTIDYPDGATVVVWGGPTCRWWLIYSGDTLTPEDRRRSLALEPMTCPPNALNTGEIDVLAPGESLRLEWGFSLR
jgi:aldose 1-epimerase